eukprot:5391517-Lingulodinium_polyedra.AAC.1
MLAHAGTVARGLERSGAERGGAGRGGAERTGTERLGEKSAIAAFRGAGVTCTQSDAPSR